MRRGLWLTRRRKARESKRFSKQVAAEARASKAQAKKAAIGSISKLRRQRQRDGFAGELDMDAQLAAMEGGGANSGTRQTRPPPQPLGQRIRPSALLSCTSIGLHLTLEVWVTVQ